MKNAKNKLIDLCIDLFINNCYYTPKVSFMIDEVNKRLELQELSEKEIRDKLTGEYGSGYIGLIMEE